MMMMVCMRRLNLKYVDSPAVLPIHGRIVRLDFKHTRFIFTIYCC